MQLSCRLLSQESFTITVEPATTIGDVKRKIEELKGAAFKAESLKLIYAGKVLDKDEDTLETVKYQESGFVVVMVAKAKPVAKPDVSQGDSSTTASTTPAATISPPAPTSQPTAPSATAQAPAAAAAPNVSTTPSASAPVQGAFGLSPAEISQMVEAISQMGYPKSEVEQALRASFFNPERAVEYLISGVPPGAGHRAPNPAISAAAAAPVAPAQVGQEGAAGNQALANLRNSPQFAMMRAMVQQDPQLLEQFMQSMGQSNPALVEAIRDNEEEFLAMLNAELPEGEEDEMDEEELGALQDLMGGGGGQGGAPPGVHYVNVTAEEQAAIERLKALGFPEQMVIEAFIACDKNEELAANLLFSGLED